MKRFSVAIIFILVAASTSFAQYPPAYRTPNAPTITRASDGTTYTTIPSGNKNTTYGSNGDVYRTVPNVNAWITTGQDGGPWTTIR